MQQSAVTWIRVGTGTENVPCALCVIWRRGDDPPPPAWTENRRYVRVGEIADGLRYCLLLRGKSTVQRAPSVLFSEIKNGVSVGRRRPPTYGFEFAKNYGFEFAKNTLGTKASHSIAQLDRHERRTPLPSLRHTRNETPAPPPRRWCKQATSSWLMKSRCSHSRHCIQGCKGVWVIR